MEKGKESHLHSTHLHSKKETFVYAFGNNIYVNLTNRCTANCSFCVRNEKDSVGEAESLFLEREPTAEEVLAEIEKFDFSHYQELVFCGYGEPTCAVDVLVEVAQGFKKNHRNKVRVNTNGTGRLYHGRDILKEMDAAVDGYSISLNAPDKKKYQELTRPIYENAYEEMLRFAADAKEQGKEVVFSVLDILSEEEIEESKKAAASYGIPLKIRKYIEGGSDGHSEDK